MTQADDTGTTGGKTFTQAELNAVVQDRLKREREKYADYDELKAKAAEADKAASQLDKIQQQMTAMAERAEKSERQTMIREVADELKISVKKAERLQGKTKEELLSDGRDFYADDLKSGNSEAEGESAEGAPQQQTTAQRGRPKETLRSGAPRTESTPEETDPRKLAELIPRQ